jgi:hypothetical protein
MGPETGRVETSSDERGNLLSMLTCSNIQPVQQTIERLYNKA